MKRLLRANGATGAAAVNSCRVRFADRFAKSVRKKCPLALSIPFGGTDILVCVLDQSRTDRNVCATEKDFFSERSNERSAKRTLQG